MTAWQEEYNRRLRRVLDVTDDTLEVTVTPISERGFNTGCDTCGWGADTTSVDIRVTVFTKDKRGTYAISRSFELGELMREMDEVEDD